MNYEFIFFVYYDYNLQNQGFLHLYYLNLFDKSFSKKTKDNVFAHKYVVDAAVKNKVSLGTGQRNQNNKANNKTRDMSPSFLPVINPPQTIINDVKTNVFAIANHTLLFPNTPLNKYWDATENKRPP